MSRYEVYLRELTRAERIKHTTKQIRVSVVDDLRDEIEELFSNKQQPVEILYQEVE